MKKVVYAALFCSLLLMTGTLFGIFVAFFTREYTVEEVVKSRINRMNIIDGRVNR